MFGNLPNEASESDRLENPYQSPIAPFASAPRKNTLTSPLRWSLIGAAGGGCLGAALIVAALIVLFTPKAGGEDDEVGPMLVAMLPVLAVGFVMVCAMIGLLVGALFGTIACVVTPPSRREVPTDDVLALN